MKLIHCADLHLDSAMTSFLPPQKAAERKHELLVSFERMLDYAEENGVSAVLIAGDLFDKKTVSATARNFVMQQIDSHSGLSFYYLCGNHDGDGFTGYYDVLPDNLKLFSGDWTYYELDETGDVILAGAEFTDVPAQMLLGSLRLDSQKINIVTLHGQESAYGARDKAEIINLDALRNRFIDYLALGHVHAHKEEKLDARGVYVYPGCLEGRGYDECGEHGFMLLEIDSTSHSVKGEFVPFATRTVYDVEVDVTGCRTSMDAEVTVRNQILSSGGTSRDMMHITLTGELDIDAEVNVDYIQKRIEPEYYAVRVKDRTVVKVDYEMYALDKSLKGEFIRRVHADESLSDEEKGVVIRYGIRALGGGMLMD